MEFRDMDSGNSGSIQSSSGGDEEYDSRATSISPFMNPTGHVGGPISAPPPPPHHTMFDSIPNYFNPISQPFSNQNSLLNLDMVWSKTNLRSEPNNTDQINPLLASSSSIQPFFGSQVQQSLLPFNTTDQSPSAVQFPPVISDHQTQMVRNPKKRSRASRRAPTTVLTTDTTNFRAMVQEFTGIPATPFTSSSFPRTRLDLFGTPSSIRSNPSLDFSQPPYLLRPFAQKPPPPPPPFSSSNSLLSSSFVDLNACTTSTNNLTSGSTNSASNSTSVNYQLLPPDQLPFLKQPLTMQNPILTFQSFLHNQTPPKYQRTQGSLEIPSNDELGLSHGHVNNPTLTGLPNLVSSDGTTSRSYNNPASWGDGNGSNDGDQSHMRFVNGSFNSSDDVKNGKVNYSTSSSNFNGVKGPGSVSTRGEGMVEPWLCSSD